MSDVLVKGRQGSVSLLNYCDLKSGVGEDVRNVMRAGASVLTLYSFLGLMCKMSAQLILDGNASKKRQKRTALGCLLTWSVVVTESVICSSGRVSLYA